MKYIASELLVFVIALAALFSVVTCVVILFILIQECGRWSVRKFRGVAQIGVLSLRAQSDLFHDDAWSARGRKNVEWKRTLRKVPVTGEPVVLNDFPAPCRGLPQ
jgi:hypothetical protein